MSLQNRVRNRLVLFRQAGCVHTCCTAAAMHALRHRHSIMQALSTHLCMWHVQTCPAKLAY
jgi:hypothetical protein